MTRPPCEPAHLTMPVGLACPVCGAKIAAFGDWEGHYRRTVDGAKPGWEIDPKWQGRWKKRDET